MNVNKNSGMENGNFFQSVLQLVAGLLLVSLVLALPALAFRHHGPGDPEQMIADLTTRLSLTEDQVSQIRTIFEEKMQKEKELFQSSGSDENKDRSAIRSQMEAIRESTETQLAQVLTAEQLEKYKELMEEQRQKMRDRMGKGPRRMDN